MWICNLIGWCIMLLMIAEHKQYNSRSIYQAKGCDKLQSPLHSSFEFQVLSLAKPKGWDMLQRITHSTRLQYIKERFLLVLLALFFKATYAWLHRWSDLTACIPFPCERQSWCEGRAVVLGGRKERREKERRRRRKREQDPSDELGQVSFCI